jgi:hypothetical protein
LHPPSRPELDHSEILFSQLIPTGRKGEYYGFYEISDKGTSWLVPSTTEPARYRLHPPSRPADPGRLSWKI